MSEPDNQLGTLIESTRQDAQAQQDKLVSDLQRAARPARGKQLFAGVLLAVCAGVLFYQYPRFAEPYAWPDAASNSAGVEGDLAAVVGLIETYRAAQGKLPELLSQVPMPEGLAARMAESPLQYRPSAQAYTLAWDLPHWHATFDSQSQALRVEPLAKK